MTSTRYSSFFIELLTIFRRSLLRMVIRSLTIIIFGDLEPDSTLDMGLLYILDRSVSNISETMEFCFNIPSFCSVKRCSSLLELMEVTTFEAYTTFLSLCTPLVNPPYRVISLLICNFYLYLPTVAIS